MLSIPDTYFEINGSDLSKQVGIWHSTLRNDLTMNNLSSLGYTTPVNYPSGVRLLQTGCCQSLSLWANESKDSLPYKHGGSSIAVASKRSCPIPILSNSGFSSPYEMVFSSTASMSLRYNSSTSRIEYKLSSSSTWSNFIYTYEEHYQPHRIPYSFNGVFIAIQSPGGGGGGGTVSNGAVASQCTGGGGGGAGAFVILYVDMKALNDSWPGATLDILLGSKGSHGGLEDNTYSSMTAAPGSDGGDSTVYIREHTEGWEELVVRVGGGKGGASNLYTTETSNSGGSGGYVYQYYMPSNIVQAVFMTSGQSGGSSGTPSGYAFGVGYGNKDGSNGGSFGYSTYGPQMLADKANIRREVSSGSVTYHVGQGQLAANWGFDGQRSGGGGGGASICGSVSGVSPDSTRQGFGMGGQGGPADGTWVYKSQDGQQGIIQIYMAF